MSNQWTVRFRQVMPHDEEMLYAWRHDAETQRWSLSPAPTPEQHSEWMSTNVGQDSVLLARRVNRAGEETPLALVQLRGTDFSINVAPEQRGHGVGQRVVKAMQQQPTTSELRAYVMAGNTASLQMFAACGFRLLRANELYELLWRRPHA